MDDMETMTMMSSAAPAATSQLPPGFRFHPTDEELILHYLRNRAASLPCPVPIIADVDIYKFDPWDLPSKAVYGDGEWYFFSPRDRKYPNGIRPNRAAGSGYWKATGTDKPVHDTATGDSVGVKKALVFYKGRPPKGAKTDWIMHEYRLAAAAAAPLAAFRPPVVRFRNVSMRLDDWVLCRIYNKSGQASSPMVPPLVADYDHLMMDNDEHSAGGLDDICGGFYAPPATSSSGTGTATTTCSVNQQQQHAAAPRLPKIIPSSIVFDDSALAQIFDDTAVPAGADQQHATLFAMHPSLNQLLAIGAHSSESGALIYHPSYDDPAGGAAAAAGAAKRKVSPGECAGNPPANKRHHVSCFDAPTTSSSQLQVLGGLNHDVLSQF